tara:strand:+ start:172 stop:390 length:219 start_codon:yes stop_codon:yes gene_type:complete
MIKIWLLISMVSMPGMPSVKHTAELWFDKTKCEVRRVNIENDLQNKAEAQGFNPFFVHTWCLESAMFVSSDT